MLWIRFMTQDREPKPKSVDRDIPFELALCAL
jgi:cell division FtsZ-interacting protein ZapD